MQSNLVYEFYKPLRNYLRQFSSIDSLYVIRAYILYLQLKQPFPSDIQANRYFLRNYSTTRAVFEWELDLLAREIILNASETAKKTLRQWADFSSAINKIKDLENNISGIRTHIGQDNILLEIHRIAHRQFPWQRKDSNHAILRYFKIFSTEKFAPILRNSIGMSASEFYTIGLAFLATFIDKFEIELPVTIKIPNVSQENVDRFVRLFSATFSEIKENTKTIQSYSAEYAYTFNPLRKYPLIKLKNRAVDTVISPIPTFLFKGFTEGLYYEICSKEGFSDAMGESFQNYVGEVLTTANIGKKYSVYNETQYDSSEKNKHSIDWILSDSSANLFIECKSKKLRLESKIKISDSISLNEDLEKMSGFIVQAYKTVIEALEGRYAHWKPNDNPCYVLVVTLEDWYLFGAELLGAINAAVESKLVIENIDPKIIKEIPYTVCSCADLEIAARIIDLRTIDEVMKKKTKGDRSEWHFYTQLITDFSAEARALRSPLFPADWKKIHPALSGKYDLK